MPRQDSSIPGVEDSGSERSCPCVLCSVEETIFYWIELFISYLCSKYSKLEFKEDDQNADKSNTRFKSGFADLQLFMVKMSCLRKFRIFQELYWEYANVFYLIMSFFSKAFS